MARHVSLRTDFEARFGIETKANRKIFGQFPDIGSLLMYYRHFPTGTRRGAQSSEPVDRLRGQTGTRFPHVWISCGIKRLSTLDLFGASRYRSQDHMHRKAARRSLG